jgi:hypothetical protein
LVRLGLYVGDFFHDWHGVTTVDLHVDNVVGGGVVESFERDEKDVR